MHQQQSQALLDGAQQCVVLQGRLPAAVLSLRSWKGTETNEQGASLAESLAAIAQPTKAALHAALQDQRD